MSRKKKVLTDSGEVTAKLKVPSGTSMQDFKKVIETFIKDGRKENRIHFWVTDCIIRNGYYEVIFAGEKIRRFLGFEKRQKKIRLSHLEMIFISELPNELIRRKKRELELKHKAEFDVTVIAQLSKYSDKKILVILLAEEVA